jgi:hypothetical protein
MKIWITLILLMLCASCKISQDFDSGVQGTASMSQSEKIYQLVPAFWVTNGKTRSGGKPDGVLVFSEKQFLVFAKRLEFTYLFLEQWGALDCAVYNRDARELTMDTDETCQMFLPKFKSLGVFFENLNNREMESSVDEVSIGESNELNQGEIRLIVERLIVRSENSSNLQLKEFPTDGKHKFYLTVVNRRNTESGFDFQINEFEPHIQWRYQPNMAEICQRAGEGEFSKNKLIDDCAPQQLIIMSREETTGQWWPSIQSFFKRK